MTFNHDSAPRRRGAGAVRWLPRLALGLGLGLCLAAPAALPAGALPPAGGGAQQAAESEPVVYQVAVAVRGRAPGDDEPVVFAGLAIIESTVIKAPNAPTVAEIAVDFSAVTARGETSGATYQVDSPTRQQRRLNQTQAIDISFPYYRESAPLSARATTASIRLNPAGKPLRSLVIDRGGSNERAPAQE